MRALLFLFYRMARECLDIKMYESIVQRRSDAATPEAKRAKTEKYIIANESNIKERLNIMF